MPQIHHIRVAVRDRSGRRGSEGEAVDLGAEDSFWDEGLARACTYQRTAGGAYRCLPVAVFGIFADDLCTTPVASAATAMCPALSDRFSRVTTLSGPWCAQVGEAFQLGSRVNLGQPQVGYRQNQFGRCVAFTPTFVYYTKQNTLDPAMFVEGTARTQ